VTTGGHHHACPFCPKSATKSATKKKREREGKRGKERERGKIMRKIVNIVH
jgi:hypothetical protein